MKTKTSRNLDSKILCGGEDSVVISQVGFQRGFHPNAKYFEDETLLLLLWCSPHHWIPGPCSFLLLLCLQSLGAF